ncbi:PIN domain-containing protein [Candidatus Nitrospira nitrosa]|nr:PIN domain-containing protein [Candidatus Nitrospira nitrosa]
MGNAFIRSIRQQQGRIGLPEIVAKELHNKIKEEGIRLTKTLGDTLRAAGHFTGRKMALVVPLDEKSFEDGLRNRLDQLSSCLEKIPFTHQHAQAALDRVIQGIAPSLAKSEEFRDCAIWEATLELASNFSVHLITNDRGFYRNRDVTQGIAQELASDCQKTPQVVQIHESIAAYLRTFPAPMITFSMNSVESRIEAWVRTDFGTSLPYQGGTLGNRLASEVQHFFTEEVNQFAIQFTQEFELVEGYKEGKGRIYQPAFVTAKGSCAYCTTTNTVTEVTNPGYSIYVGEDKRLITSISHFRGFSMGF